MAAALQLIIAGLVISFVVYLYQRFIKNKVDKAHEFAGAVYNHQGKMINNYVSKYGTKTVDQEIIDDDFYEQVMLEIEEDKKVKATWARALSQSDGNKDKAEAIYIQERVKTLSHIEKNNKKPKIDLYISQKTSKQQMNSTRDTKEEFSIGTYLLSIGMNVFGLAVVFVVFVAFLKIFVWTH